MFPDQCCEQRKGAARARAAAGCGLPRAGCPVSGFYITTIGFTVEVTISRYLTGKTDFARQNMAEVISYDWKGLP